jgi:general secretion pathway protein A
LIIDEGQKIPVFCLEILREFLNYETNEYKLLQIVIFAQIEFEKTIQNHPNFADRINLYHFLKPLSFSDTRKMIKFRLEQSRGSGKRLELFKLPALAAVYRATDGYPRKIINLCHQTILTMIIQNKKTIGYFLVRRCANRIFHNESISWKRITAAVAVSVGVLAIIGALLTSSQLKAYLPWENKISKILVVPKDTPARMTPAPQLDTPVVQAQLPVVEEQAAPAAETAPEPPPLTVAQNENEAAPANQKQAVTVAEIQSDAPDDASGESQPVQNAYSDLLGKLIVQRDETLSRIIQKVYGIYNSRYFRSLILANPLIHDPDRVEVGQTIALPAIPAKVRPLNQRKWWVQVEEKDTLEAAFNFMRSYPDQAPPVRLIPYWTSETGTKFVLVLKGIYATQKAAYKQIHELPPDISSEVKIISLWNEEAVFFANPFLVSRKNK